MRRSSFQRGMRAMVVEVGPEIEQLVFEICRRPEQDVDSVRIASDTFARSWLCEGLAVSRASVQLPSGAGEQDAPRAPAIRRGCGPTRADWAIVAGSGSR